MTREEFLVAARKGQGRAVLALRNGEFEASFHDLRRLVLRWPGFDFQMECYRGWYTVELIEASSHADVLTALLVRHLARVKGSRCDKKHRASAVGELAKRRFEPAREALRTYFDPSAEFWLGDEIVEADGLGGLEWILDHSSGHFKPDDTWQIRWWLDDLKESVGEAAVSEWLATASSKWPIVGEFLRSAEDREKRPRRREPEPSISFEELRRQYFAAEPRPRPSILPWFAQATDEDVKRAWEAFVVEDEGDYLWLLRLGCTLGRKPQFADVDKVIARALARNAGQNPFARSLEGLADPRVRQLGFDLIGAGWVADGIGLFRSNYRTGDEGFLLEKARSLTDDEDLHFAGLDFLDIPKETVHPDLLLWTCEATPCSFCRESALRHLDEVGGVPEAILREALLDCDSDARELAERRLGVC